MATDSRTLDAGSSSATASTRYSIEVTSSVVFVTELRRSIDFYVRLLGCIVTVHEPRAALMLTTGGFQIYLVERGSRATHPLGGIGNQGIMWAAASAEDLAAFADALKEAHCYVDEHAEGGVNFIEGSDPDGLRIVVAHPGPDTQSRSIVASRFYA